MFKGVNLPCRWAEKVFQYKIFINPRVSMLWSHCKFTSCQSPSYSLNSNSFLNLEQKSRIYRLCLAKMRRNSFVTSESAGSLQNPKLWKSWSGVINLISTWRFNIAIFLVSYLHPCHVLTAGSLCHQYKQKC